MQLEGKVFAITGAASGLGAAIAGMLASEGANLVLMDRQPEQLEQVVQHCRATFLDVADRDGSSTVAHFLEQTLDVTDETAVVRCFEQITTQFQQLNGLVNCAGIMRDAMLLKVKEGKVTDRMTLTQFQQVLEVNLTGTFLCGREAAAQMINTGSEGVIINISSVSRAGNVGQSNYSASKAAVSAMSVTWAKELARYKIRVADIAPGVFATSMTEVMKPEAMARLTAAIPKQRLGQPAEIADAVRFLISNDYFTGRTLELDGGIRV